MPAIRRCYSRYTGCFPALGSPGHPAGTWRAGAVTWVEGGGVEGGGVAPLRWPLSPGPGGAPADPVSGLSLEFQQFSFTSQGQAVEERITEQDDPGKLSLSWTAAVMSRSSMAPRLTLCSCMT